MHTVQAKTLRPFAPYGGVAPAWSAFAGVSKSVPNLAAKALAFTTDESTRFIRIVSDCARIGSHYDVYRWLSGEVQHFLPHDILLAAWGDFAKWDLTLDLTSGLPGVRTAQLAHCRVHDLVRHAYAQWTDADRQPVLLKTSDAVVMQPSCHCPIHVAFRGMRSILVHGVHDRRTGVDSIFIALGSGSVIKGRSMLRFVSIVDPLVHQIDAAFRKVAAYPVADGASPVRDGSNVLHLSQRERQVLESVCRGETNLDIAVTLEISPFTVKNHVQRIFRKIGVTNRTQAAARYTEAMRQAALRLARPSSEAAEESG
jgi:transcriptional regulator EpsA